MPSRKAHNTSDQTQTLAAWFEARCARSAGRDALVWLKDGSKPAAVLHFAAWARAARDWARRLIAVSEPGDRVLLLLPPGLEFAEAFWGCLLAGRIAVPVPSPDAARWKHASARLRAVLRDADARIAVLMPDDRSRFEGLWVEGSDDGSRPVLLSPGDVGPVAMIDDGGELPAVDPSIPAYLQYTSGSVGTPRGVIVSQQAVLAQCAAAAAAMHVDADSRILSWLPHHHDYGLVLGVLGPVQTGATAFLMSPMAFLRHPLRWLEAIERHRITHTGAPHFAFAACLREAATQGGWTGSLASLRSVSCGAEPIRASTMHQFVRVFAANGFDPGALAPSYGMAETVLASTTTPFGRGLVHRRFDGGQDVVGCGRPIDGMALAIVDPQCGVRLAEGQVGEIWLSGDSMGSGYWGDRDGTSAAFAAELDDASGPWLRSGDLGFQQDGELYVVGRLKDVLIANGRNIAPQDLEWSAQSSSPQLDGAAAAAFAIDGPDGEGVVLALEVDQRLDAKTLDALGRSVADALMAIHDVALAELVWVRRGSLPRTSSGKMRRGTVRDDYLAGRLVRVGAGQVHADTLSIAALAAYPAGSTVKRLAALWNETLPRGPRTADDRFFDLGGDSLAATRLASRVQARFGVDWSAADVFRQPVLGGMAEAIDAAACVDRPVCIERQSRGGDLPVSSAQRRMWMVQQLTPGTTAYNMGLAFRIEGDLQPAMFAKAVDHVAARHEAFRTRFVAAGDDVVQRIDPPTPAPLAFEDLGALPAVEREEAMHARAGECLQAAFDLERGPLHRALLVRLAPDQHVFLWAIHHAIGDLWSFALLLNELSDAYTALETGRSPESPPRQFDYADYAAWQAAPDQQAALRPQVERWMERLAGLAPLALPTDFPRSAAPTGRGGRITRALPESLRTRIRQQAAALGLTPFMLLLAVFKLQLSRWCGQSDIAVGTPIANRHRLAAECLVGTLVNTVVLRTRVDAATDFADLTQRVRSVAIEAQADQEAPFETLVERLVGARDATLPPLVQVLFNLIAAPVDRLELAGRRIGPVDIERGGAQFELSLGIDLDVFGQLHLEYASDRFTPGTAKGVVDAYFQLLDQVLAEPSLPLASYRMSMPMARSTGPAVAPTASGGLEPRQESRPSSEGLTSPDEATVLRIASDLLGVASVSPDDNFFDLGGHSLLALRFAHAVEQATGHRPSILAVSQSSFRALALAASAARERATAGG